MDCKHGKILYGSKCINCERENKMLTINFDNGRIWHSDCENNCDGSPMVETKANVMFDGKPYGLMKCLSCNKQGYYPNGGSGKFETKEVNEV